VRRLTDANGFSGPVLNSSPLARRWTSGASLAERGARDSPRYAMEIVGKKSQGLSVTALKEDKTVIISFNDRSLNFYVTDALKESLKETINSKICRIFIAGSITR
jgi:hypothetical protein